MRDKEEIAKNRERIRQLILDFLRVESMYRKELHLACCRKLGKSNEPSFKPSRICKNMPDSWFDVPLKEMLESKMLSKERRGKYMHYNLVKQKAPLVNKLL